MPTRRRTTHARRGFVYFPLTDVFYPNWKIVITTSGGTSYIIADITSESNNYLLYANVNRNMTSGLSTFSLRISNPDGMFSGVFNTGDSIVIYADYSNGDTVIFRGKLDNVFDSVTNNGYYLDIDGRDYPEIMDLPIIIKAVISTADVVLCDILYNYFNDVTLSYWNGKEWIDATYDPDTRSVSWDGKEAYDFPTTSMTFAYQYRKGWEVIREVCERAGLDCYMWYDSGWKLRIFNSNSIKNNTVSVQFGSNLIGANRIGVNSHDIYNRVTVFGKQESSNILLLTTKDDTSSQSQTWVKGMVLDEPSLTSMEEVKEKAQFELEKGTKKPLSGQFNVVGMSGIQPGEQIMISIPKINIAGYYTIASFTQSLTAQGWTTNLEITKELVKLHHVFKPKVDIEAAAKAYKNLNAMENSYTIYFDEDESLIDIHDNTEEVDGKLQLKSGKTSGTATTKIHYADKNITQCELRKHSNFPIDENDEYEVSNDGGATWEKYVVGAGNVHTFTTTGNALVCRLYLKRDSVSDPTPSYESICLLYK